MKNVTGILAILVLTGCNASDGTNINSIGNNTTPTTLSASTPQPKTTPAPVVTPSPTPSPSTTPVVKVDPFSPFNEKYTYISEYDSNHHFTGLKRLDFKLGMIGVYNQVVSPVTFVYWSGAQDSNGFPILSACKADYVELMDSDTNTHKLTIRDISEASHPVFQSGSIYNFYTDPNYADQYFYSPTSPCQDLLGDWQITVIAGSYNNQEMSR
jgi:hypothetical protein